jgi:hypothetical protein
MFRKKCVLVFELEATFIACALHVARMRERGEMYGKFLSRNLMRINHLGKLGVG